MYFISGINSLSAAVIELKKLRCDCHCGSPSLAALLSILKMWVGTVAIETQEVQYFLLNVVMEQKLPNSDCLVSAETVSIPRR